MKNDIFLSLKNMYKTYPNGVQAVHDFNLDVKPKEFIVFVGPSGCGKSTTLRMIAGLEEITHGDLYIDQRLANNLSPKDRDIAMVFQSYALYPHMNVYNNLAFGLRMRKIRENVLDQNGKIVTGFDHKQVRHIEKDLHQIAQDLEKVSRSVIKAKTIGDVEKQEAVLEKLALMHNSLTEEKGKKEKELAFYQSNEVPIYQTRRYKKHEIDEKVRKAAQVLDIEKYLFSRPRELSGGQRQRVALGRSIVRNARLFLMDEPLSNLDAKLRISMRSEIVALHRALEATTIYVTHDQIEAMTMADRIVVMKDGFIQQIGSPLEIYHQPVNVFVATFMGSPAMNVFPSTYHNRVVNINGSDVSLAPAKERIIFEFSHEQVKKLEQQNANLLRFLDSHNLELEKNKSNFLNKKILNKIKDKNELISSNNELINNYIEFYNSQTHQVILGLRPENIQLLKAPEGKAIKAEVTFVELLGKEYYVHLILNETKIIASVSPKNQFEVGETVFIDFEDEHLNVFDSLSELRIE